MKQIRVILADQHINVLGAIRNLLEEEAKTVLMVADETSLWAALENFKPDLVVADLSLLFPGTQHIPQTLKDKYPLVKLIILSSYEEKPVLEEAMATGAEGFVLKHRAVIDLIPAIREVLQGRNYIHNISDNDSVPRYPWGDAKEG
jgi:two-component system, NarL family, nitrate/nitrite response regulator NarL